MKVVGRRKQIAFLLAFLFLPLCTYAMDIDFNSVNPFGTIQNGDKYDQVSLYDSAVVAMTGGEILSIVAHDHSTVNISGGSVSTIYLYDSENATINLFGGDITKGFYGMLNAPNAINIYVKEFNVWQDQDRAYLSGKWANDSNFEFYFLRSQGLPDIVSLHIIPEPLSISLLAMGSALIFYKRKS